MLATGPQRVRTAGRRRRVVLATATAVVVGLTAASGTGRAGAAPAVGSSLARLAHRLVERGSPGAIVVVRTPGGVRRAAAGVSRLGSRSAIHASDRYRVASVTKPFVAAVVLGLVADGRVRLGDSVERWLPGLVPNGRAVTIRELLGHTSGLFDYDQDDAWVKARIAAPARVWTPRQLVTVATRHPPLFAPGTDWSYSNTNYVLLGLVVERITRHSLGEELDSRIVGPLGLHATSYPVGAGLSGNVAHGYQGAAPGLPIPAGRLVDVTTRVSPSAWGAGQLVSDADDLTSFFAALLGGRLLPSAELRDMTSPVSGGKSVPFTVGYGLGLDIFHTSCGAAYGHLGDMPGYRNVVMARPDGRRVVAVMVNVSSERLRWEEIQRTASTAFCTG